MAQEGDASKGKRYPGEYLSYTALLLSIIPPFAIVTLALSIIALVKINKAKVVGWWRKFIVWYCIALSLIQILFISLFLISIFSGTACFNNEIYSSNPVPEAVTCENNITTLDFLDIVPLVAF